MSQDAFGRYTSQGGRPINEIGSTTPGIEFSESERPAVGLLPAPYLPAGRFDAHKRSNIVLSAGAPVALDSQGQLVPAGIPGGHTFVYSALDFSVGLPAAKKAADGTAVTAASNSIMASGLTGNKTGNFLPCLGVVSYNVFQHEGGVAGTWPLYTMDHSNPVNFSVHNTMAQDLVAVTCDYVLQCPYIFGKNLLAATTKILDNDANEVAVLSDTAKSYPFAHDELIATATVAQAAVNASGTLQAAGQVVSTGISGSLTNLEIVYVSPTCGAGDNGDGTDINLGNLTFASGATGLTLKVGTAGSAGAAVTFATLSTKGAHMMYEANTSKYVVLSNRNGAAVTVSASPVIFRLELEAQIVPGDMIICRAGKFVKFNADRHDGSEILGQCLRVDKSPVGKDYLDRVRTAYARSSTVAHRMAGSATRGVPQLLHLVTDGAQIISGTNKSLAGTALTGATLTTPPLALIVFNLFR